MGWTFLGEVEEESLTAGEWERIYLLVNQFGLRHREVEIDPTHCPTCRNVHAAVLLTRETSFDDAVEAVALMPAASLVDAFMPESS